METNREITDLFERYKKFAKNPVAAAILTQTQMDLESVVVPPPDGIDDDPELIDVETAAKLCNCHPHTIYRAVQNGTLRASPFSPFKVTVES